MAICDGTFKIPLTTPEVAGLRHQIHNLLHASKLDFQFEGIANDDVRKTVSGFLKALQ
jgi:hypothetical protein